MKFMNPNPLLRFGIAIALLVAARTPPLQAREKSRADCPNRFSLSYRLGFDISAHFKTVRPLSQLLNYIPETGHDVPRNYVIGTPYETYVRVDINGNEYIDPETGEIVYATWNWGVSSLDQINPETGTVQMSTITEVHQEAREIPDEEITHGLELIYNRRLGRLGKGYWGLEAAFAFDQVGLRTVGEANLYQTWITDTYRLLGPVPDVFVEPPQGGFEAQGPGGWPLLTAEPNSGSRQTSVQTIANAVTGRYWFDADLFGFRFGPYAEFPLGDKFSVSLNGGLALLLVQSKFSYEERVEGYPNLSSAGDGKDSDLLVGGYINGRVQYFLSETVNLFVGAQWQEMSRYKQQLGGKEACVDVGGRVFFTAGIGFSF